MSARDTHGGLKYYLAGEDMSVALTSVYFSRTWSMSPEQNCDSLPL